MLIKFANNIWILKYYLQSLQCGIIIEVMKLKVYISKYTERCIISRLFRKTSSCFFCAFSVFGGIIMKEYKTPTTVREFKEFLKQFPDDAILGFSNQPVQTMIYDDRFDEKYLSFQEPTQTEIIDVNELLDQNIC